MTDVTVDLASQVHEGTPKPLIFISHDARDASIAEAFSRLLASVSAGMLKSFRSSDKKGSQGFEYGVEWYPELMRVLKSASDVVCLLTTRSLGRPWMLYEVGVAKGKLDISVHGLALGVPLAKASVGPFAQFQNSDDDLDSITALVDQLVRRLPNADPDLETIRAQVATFKSKVDADLAQQLPQDDHQGVLEGEASTAKLFEEIKVMFQDLPSRFEWPSVLSNREQRPRWPRLEINVLEKFVRTMSLGERSAALMALVIAVLTQDKVPWIYELGVEAYRMSLIGEPESAERAITGFRKAVGMLSMAPFSRDLRLNRDMQVFLREMVSILDGLIEDERTVSE